MNSLTLRIDSRSQNWIAYWQLHGKPLGDRINVPKETISDLLNDNAALSQVLQQAGSRPMFDREALHSLGYRLKSTFFRSDHVELCAILAGSGPHDFQLCSADCDVLNLPWELIELSNQMPIGCDPNWSIRRIMPDVPLVPEVLLPAGPLRILFLAAAPLDQDQLNYEREEDIFLKAANRLGEQVSLQIVESGGIEELATLVTAYKPHVVHLSGHGELSEGRGIFVFEGERGETDDWEADSIFAKVFRDSPTRLVFLNGCHTSRSAVSGLCQALVTAGVPMALGWAARVADDRAIDFAEEFYNRLLANEPVYSAIAHARDRIRPKGMVYDTTLDATFILPQFYASTVGHSLYDSELPPEPLRPNNNDTQLDGDITRLCRKTPY